MQDLLIGICLFVLVFGCLVIIHELGHYSMARLFNVGVKEFAVGFGNKLFSVTDRNKTQWCIRAFPFGGFVNIVHTEEEKIEANLDCDVINDKKYYQKLLIFLGGPLFNIIAAFIFSCVVLAWVGQTMPAGNIIDTTNTPMIQKGDQIVRIDGVEVKNWQEIQLNLLGKKEAAIAIKRNSQVHLEIVKATETTEPIKQNLIFSLYKMIKKTFGYDTTNVKTVYKWDLAPVKGEIVHYTILSAILAALSFIYMSIVDFFGLLKIIFTAGPSILSGPLGMGKGLLSAAFKGMDSLLWMTIKLSLSLGLFNLLPLPMLDGGKIFTTTIEKITGKVLGEKFEYFWGLSGVILLGCLMTYITFIDMFR